MYTFLIALIKLENILLNKHVFLICLRNILNFIDWIGGELCSLRPNLFIQKKEKPNFKILKATWINLPKKKKKIIRFYS